MSQPIIEVENLSKKFKITHREKYYSLRDTIVDTFNFKKEKTTREDFWALQDINFKVNEGDVLGIIGRNGAGKSTLLKVLSQITPPTAGSVKMRGRVASLLEVGTGFSPELTGRENVYLNGAILGMTQKEISKKFDEIIDFSGIEKFLDTPVKRYSSGMYMRLAFSIAAHLEPEILLIDEVLAVGDAEFQKKCLGKMDDVSRSGRTILFVSHNMGAIQQLCKKCLCLHRGKSMILGDTEEVINKYLSNSKSVTEGINVRSTKGGEIAKITNISINSESDENTGVVKSDKNLVISFTIISKNDIRCGAFLKIRDIYDKPIIWSDSGILTGQLFNIKQGTNTLTVDFDPPKLAVGEYKIDCGLLVPNIEWIDYIEDACRFSINFYDPTSTGITLTNENAVYFLPHRWSEIINDHE